MILKRAFSFDDKGVSSVLKVRLFSKVQTLQIKLSSFGFTGTLPSTPVTPFKSQKLEFNVKSLLIIWQWRNVVLCVCLQNFSS